MPRTLLLADDSITIQKMVAITFQNEDFAITAVDNGEDALTKARQIKPDIILADVVMPRRNGYELCQAIKADPALRSIPVLLLAGTFEAFDEGKAVAAQANGHIVKPFDSQVLLDRVTALVTGQPLPAAAAPPAPQPVAPRPAAPMALPVPPAPPAPPAFAMPRPPVTPGFATGIPPQRSPSMAPPPPPTPGAALPPLFRPPMASPPSVAAPARPPAPFIPGAGLPPLQPIPLVSQTAPTRPPFVGTPTPMLIPGGLPPIGSPAGLGPPRPGSAPPSANPLNVPPPAGISIGRPATRPPTPAPVQPRPMSLTPAPWAVSSSPVVPQRAPVPPAPAPSAVPRSSTVAWSNELGIPAAPAAPLGQRAKPTPTPMWGVAVSRPDPAGFGKSPSPVARPPAASVVVDPGLSSSPTDLSLDVAMDDETSKGALELPLDDTPLELEPASAPTFNQASIRASASAQLDISETGPEESIRTSSLSDLAQGGSRSAPVGEIEIDGDGSPGDEIELASAHEFLPGAPKSPPTPRPAAAKPSPPAAPAARAADGGEGALRAALSQASRDVIEKIAWEVVPQLAEVIIREHVERLARERSPK